MYDANGNILKVTDADNYVTAYAYDAKNIVETIKYKNGHLVRMVDRNGTTTFALDLLTGLNMDWHCALVTN